jgi:transcriptional regulator with XRE-family HTH domain
MRRILARSPFRIGRLVFWYPIGYHWVMDAAALLRRVRQRSGLTLRGLAAKADTSHSALAAYESGRKVPSVETLDRIVRAAGYELGVELTPAVGGADREARGRELAEVLDLAEQFPARHTETLDLPVFPRAS